MRASSKQEPGVVVRSGSPRVQRLPPKTRPGAHAGLRAPATTPGSGIVVPVLDSKHFDFSYLTKNTSEVVRLVAAVNAVPYSSGELVVRLHEAEIDDGTLEVKAFATAPSRQDPREFVRGTPDALITILSSDVAPKYSNTAISTVNGPFLTVLMDVGMGSPQGTFAFTLSVDLILREQ